MTLDSRELFYSCAILDSNETLLTLYWYHNSFIVVQFLQNSKYLNCMTQHYENICCLKKM